MLYQLNVANGFCQFAGPAKYLKIISAASPLKIEVIANGVRSGRVLLSSKNVRAPMGFELPEDAGVVNFYGDDQNLEIWSGDQPLEYLQLTAVGGTKLAQKQVYTAGGRFLIAPANQRTKLRIKPQKDLFVGSDNVGLDGYPVLAGEFIDLETIGAVYGYKEPATVKPGNLGFIAREPNIAASSGVSDLNDIALSETTVLFKASTGIIKNSAGVESVITDGSKVQLFKALGQAFYVAKPNLNSIPNIYIYRITESEVGPWYSNEGSAAATAGSISSVSVLNEKVLVSYGDGKADLIDLLKKNCLVLDFGADSHRKTLLNDNKVISCDVVSGELKRYTLAGAAIVNTEVLPDAVLRVEGDSTGSTLYGVKATRAAYSTDNGDTWIEFSNSIAVTRLFLRDDLPFFGQGRSLYVGNKANNTLDLVITFTSAEHADTNLFNISTLFNNKTQIVQNTIAPIKVLTLDILGDPEKSVINTLEFLV